MSLKNIIQESLNKNPMGLKEALTEELRARVAVVLESMISEKSDDKFDTEFKKPYDADSEGEYDDEDGKKSMKKSSKKDKKDKEEMEEAAHDDAVKAFLAKGGKVTKAPTAEMDPGLSATFRRLRGSDANKEMIKNPNAKKPQKNNDLMSAELARQATLKMREKEKASGKFDNK